MDKARGAEGNPGKPETSNRLLAAYFVGDGFTGFYTKGDPIVTQSIIRKDKNGVTF